MTYSVKLLDESGQGSYLQYRDRTSWKTYRTAKRHAKDIAVMIGTFFGTGLIVAVWLEDGDGRILEEYR